MTLHVITFDENGTILGSRYEADHDYEAGPNEVIDDSVSHRELGRKRVDISGAEPQVVDAPDAVFQRPGVVDRQTRELIAEQFRARGADAIAARDAMASNSNIPQSVVDAHDAQIALHYLVYVALTGDRIASVEDRFFP